MTEADRETVLQALSWARTLISDPEDALGVDETVELLDRAVDILEGS